MPSLMSFEKKDIPPEYLDSATSSLEISFETITESTLILFLE